jgi:hypothetical protein
VSQELVPSFPSKQVQPEAVDFLHADLVNCPSL